MFYFEGHRLRHWIFLGELIYCILHLLSSLTERRGPSFEPLFYCRLQLLLTGGIVCMLVESEAEATEANGGYDGVGLL